MNNRCLVCSGTCEGYERTEKEMRKHRANYQKVVAALREKARMAKNAS